MLAISPGPRLPADKMDPATLAHARTKMTAAAA